MRMAETALHHGDIGSSAGGEFPRVHSEPHTRGTASRCHRKVFGDGRLCSSAALVGPAGLRAPGTASTRRATGYFGRRERGVPSTEAAPSSKSCASTATVSMVAPQHVPCKVWTLHFWDSGVLRGNRLQGHLRRPGGCRGDTERISLTWWFGQIIANSDMHAGNLAFRPGLTVAPAYDMLPMQYAPLRGGELPARPYSPALPLPAERHVWTTAANAAMAYWQRCSEELRIGESFRQICRDNANVLDALMPTV